MTDLTKLKELPRIAQMLREDAEVFSGCDYEVDHYDKAADGIEWLIAEVERLRCQVDHLINQHMPREPIPDMPGWTRVIDADRLKAENEVLRKIISECATACGAGCHQECSIEFMAMLPDEIASVVGKRARNAAIGAVVWQFIDRMTDVCEQDPAERILEQFVAAVRPAIDAALEGGGR